MTKPIRERRSRPRRKEVVAVLNESQGVRCLYQSTDWSETGMALIAPADERIPLGRSVHLCFALPGTEITVRAEGTTVRVRSRGRYKEAAVVFRRVDPAYRAYLWQFQLDSRLGGNRPHPGK